MMRAITDWIVRRVATTVSRSVVETNWEHWRNRLMKGLSMTKSFCFKMQHRLPKRRTIGLKNDIARCVTRTIRTPMVTARPTKDEPVTAKIKVSKHAVDNTAAQNFSSIAGAFETVMRDNALKNRAPMP
mmetsp:Transcript_73456/g.115854  ORF Transcript_73456/g.115854 Transcript_73456/m.115854 type:complete len:129 (-) Transcript_73456:229-615(-)